jgi:uncharacterized protein (TIGR00730 family)
MKTICVFCGSSPGSHPAYAEAARALALLFVTSGISLVYGGGNVGLMGVLADSMLGFGGHVTGVIPGHLQDLEVGHKKIQNMHVVESMHERKALMAELCDGFIALPGGFGTLEEFCEILTWAQLGLHHKPIGLLNINSYYNPLLEMFDLGVKEQFIRIQHRKLVLQSHDPKILLSLMCESQPKSAMKRPPI